MSVVVSITRTCPECRHAEHEGRVCNAVGGLGACRCSPYEWVDISDWLEEEKNEEKQEVTSLLKEKATTTPQEKATTTPPLSDDLFDRFEDWLFSPNVLWKVLLVVAVALVLIIFLTSIYISDIGF
jgi:hypothetical protein